MITKKEHQQRRHEFASRLPNNAIAVIPAASESLRNGDAHFRFRQDSDFYYLTGFNEPDALLMITSGEKSESVLFNRPRHRLEEQWTGTRLGQDGACELLGIDVAYPMTELKSKLPELLAGKQTIYYPLGRYPTWQACLFEGWQTVNGQSRRGVIAPQSFCDVTPILGNLRLFKSDEEIKLMQRAATISVAAHQRAMRASRQAKYEYELEAEIIYELSRQGCRSVAYDPIIAGGNNACILHYTDNNKTLKSGELVLIDAGGEFENYAADITRTFPINGRFSPEQRLIYSLVLKAQKAGIACIKPGVLWNEIQQVMVSILTQGLVELGLLKGTVDDLIAQEAYKTFYMHQSGHWLGLDVHDTGHYKIEGQWRALEPGMVLTVEPGLYIPANREGIENRWHGIGVRIEDDIQVTTEGHYNLSHDLVVEIDDLEALIRG